MSDKERALADLQELNRTLEDRIGQRTAELQERSAALERSLEEVRAMGDVSRAIGASLDLAEVLDTIATTRSGSRARMPVASSSWMWPASDWSSSPHSA